MCLPDEDELVSINMWNTYEMQVAMKLFLQFRVAVNALAMLAVGFEPRRSDADNADEMHVAVRLLPVAWRFVLIKNVVVMRRFLTTISTN